MISLEIRLIFITKATPLFCFHFFGYHMAFAEYTAGEVAQHNTPDDCWVVVDGRVCDVRCAYAHAETYRALYSPTYFFPNLSYISSSFRVTTATIFCRIVYPARFQPRVHVPACALAWCAEEHAMCCIRSYKRHIFSLQF